MSDRPKSIFSEIQQFSPLLTMPFVLLFLIAIALEGHMILRPILETDDPWPSWALPVSIIGMALNVIITIILVSARLRIRVEADAIFVCFFPFHIHARRIEFDDIALVYPRAYQPLTEFGGYGIHWSEKGTAYTVSGNSGVQIEFTSGHKLFLGSQKPDELARSLQEAVVHSRISSGKKFELPESFETLSQTDFSQGLTS